MWENSQPDQKGVIPNQNLMFGQVLGSGHGEVVRNFQHLMCVLKKKEKKRKDIEKNFIEIKN